jgi:hypothetical protein
MAIPLVLGPIEFQDFEIPSQIPFGGAQLLVVKKLVGGTRVIDAMGRDDIDIKWSGRFRGSLGEVRARTLDLLRVQGQQLLLSWSSLRFLVVIERFEANFQQPFEIPYSISCTVLQDLSLPILEAAPDPNALIVADINGAVGIEVSDVGVSVAVGSVQSAVAAIPQFQGASIAQIAAVQSSIQVAQTAVTGSQVTNNALVVPTGSVAGVVAGGPPAALAASLSGQADAFSELAQLYQLSALLGRASINVTNAGS